MNYYKQVYGNNCGCNSRQTRTASNCSSCNESMNSCNRNNCNDNMCGNDDACGNNACGNNECNSCATNSCGNNVYGGTGRRRGNYDNWNGCDDRFPIAMAYVPWQKFENLYSTEEALCRGTMFKELDLEFYGRSCR